MVLQISLKEKSSAFLTNIPIGRIQDKVFSELNFIFQKIKNEAAPWFEHGISCLLDRRFNQLSHAADVGPVKIIAKNITKYVIKSLCNYLNISFWWGHDSCLLSSLDKSQFIGLANPITGHQQLDNLQMTILCRIYQGRLVTVIHRIDISLMIKDTRLLCCLTSWCLLQT